jgi:hypothetical protein
MTTHSLSLACALACLALLAQPRAASAGDVAAAEDLFQQGLALMDQQEYHEACRMFEASQREDPSPGTQFNLGACYEALGRTASAWAAYVHAAELAQERGRAAQETEARARVAALEPQLSKLRIDAPPAPIEGLEVRRDGQLVSAGSLGVALNIDPGEHTIEARAPGRRPWSTKLEIKSSADSQTVAIPDLEAIEAEAPTTAARSPEPGPAPTPDPTRDRGGSDKTVGYVLGGIGLAAIGVGTVFGLMAAKQAADSEDNPSLCPDKECTRAGRDEINAAKDKAFISTLGFGAGIAALAAGVVLVLTSDSGPSKQEARRAPRVVPSGGARGGFVSIEASFP